VFGAEEIDELIVNDFDDLLPRLNALDDFLAEGFCFDALDEVARDLEIHVRFQQRHAHLTQRFANVFLGDFS